MRQDKAFKSPIAKLFITLLLAITHLLSGLLILMVSSWFIAACSIAGIGFNYLLPAVIIRALAILRIASSYFSMLVGHSHLLENLASIRLKIFSNLQNRVELSRRHALDALHQRSEEVASIWIAWVSQNTGTFLSLLLLNITCLLLTPFLTPPALIFSGIYVLIYAFLLLSIANKSAQLVSAREKAYLSITQHMEAASAWHLYANYHEQAPSLRLLRNLSESIQCRIRSASFLLFICATCTIMIMFANYSYQFTGNAAFIILPIALLGINDWLAPTLSNQKQLLNYFEAKQAITATQLNTPQLHQVTHTIRKVKVRNFKPYNTNSPPISACFDSNQISVIIGSSGSGKSRFLQALAGLIAFEGQRKLFMGSGVKHTKTLGQSGLLADCLYIEQFPYILSDTLRSNLLIANESASDNQLFDVLRLVGLAQFKNLELWLGDNGQPLSGGEKKRLGLARALLSPSTMILLDEPFEALDLDNIQSIAKIINHLAEHKIVLVATHILPKDLRYQQCITLDNAPNSHSSQLKASRGLIE